jgi:hypothetical protein
MYAAYSQEGIYILNNVEHYKEASNKDTASDIFILRALKYSENNY